MPFHISYHPLEVMLLSRVGSFVAHEQIHILQDRAHGVTKRVFTKSLADMSAADVLAI